MKEFLKQKFINYLKTHPITIIVFLIGIFVGGFISKIVSWIPLIGSFFAFFITLFFGVLNVYLLRRFFPKIK